MAANDHDWAVVIGISEYADANAASGWIGNLNGPANDAKDIADWLTKPDGGALPVANVQVIGSAPPSPTQTDIVAAFGTIAQLPTTAYCNQWAGRRLYVYVSGHGLAQGKNDAAVVTAEATRDDPLNVLVTSWIDWLWYAARFKEYVLWVDTCATRASPPITLHGCQFAPETRADAADGRLFLGFAAGYNRTAVEREIDGEWHGVFTHALLKALNGAQGTPVRTEQLKNYLINNMKKFMTPGQRKNPEVSKEPQFGTTDDLEFARPAEQPTFEVRLRFSQECIGKRVTISVNRPSPLVADSVLDEPEWRLQLEVGLYVVFVPELELVRGFQVNGGGSDAVITVP